jgi:signal transduction histidine kinase
MINNVLDASQIDCQMLVPSTSYVEPRYLIHKIVNICKSNVLRKNLRLELFIDKKLPKTLIMDSGRFSQILMNLVNNAIKFTKEGIVRIKVQWSPDLNTVPKYWQRVGATVEYTENWEQGNALIISPERTDMYRAFSPDKDSEFYGKTVLCEYWHESQGTLTLSVDDTGIGISEESIKSLFKPFHQADVTIKSTYGGSGLGLWISQSLSRILGGDLTLISALGKGSCFTLTLPCQVYDEKDMKQYSVSKSLQRCRVL